jgi:hypothetical protein
MKKKNSLRGQRGSSLVEFLVFAPAVMLLSYLAYDLNKRAEEMGSTSIASRNLAMRPEAESPDNHRKILASNFEKSEMQVDKKVRDSFKSYETSGVPSANYKLKNEIKDGLKYDDNGAKYGVTRDGLKTPTSAQDPGDTGTVSYKNIQSITDKLVSANKASDAILNTLGNLGLAAEDGIRIGQANISMPGEDNGMQKGFSLMSNLVNDGSKDAVLGVERSYADRYFMRPESGYHTNQFKNNALAGAAIGLSSSGDWNDYSKECMNKFNATEDCSPTNSFAILVGAIGTVKSAVMCFLDIWSDGGASVAQGEALRAVEGGLQEMVTEVVKSLVEKTIKKAITKATKGIEDNIVQFDKINSNIQTTISSDGTTLEGIQGANQDGN